LILVGLLTTSAFHKHNRYTPTKKEEQRRKDKEKRDALAFFAKLSLIYSTTLCAASKRRNLFLYSNLTEGNY
jgi:hypothetical protein